MKNDKKGKPNNSKSGKNNNMEDLSLYILPQKKTVISPHMKFIHSYHPEPQNQQQQEQSPTFNEQPAQPKKKLLHNIVLKPQAQSQDQHAPVVEEVPRNKVTNSSAFKSNSKLHPRQASKQVIQARQTQKNTIPGGEQKCKRVLVVYTCGSAGANQKLQISKGSLKQIIKSNTYLCDFQMLQSLQNKDMLISPIQENGMRIVYRVSEFHKIQQSTNFTVSDIKQIAQIINHQYGNYDAFIFVCGLDLISHISTHTSFMLENLSRLVIFTGGYFPSSFMYNDTINNLIQSFTIVGMAQNFNDVIVVCKNNAYRANRSISSDAGQFETISSPNLPALVKLNVKVQIKEHLFLPKPKQPFSIWTDISTRVSIINLQALQYQVNNPAIDGFVIQSYGSSSLPQNEAILQIFKKAAENKGKVFVNVGQPVRKVTTSLMKEYLQNYHIYYGGDMTSQAAVAKLAYLLSKNLSRAQIQRLVQTNMRGELTEQQTGVKFSALHLSFMENIQDSIKQYYPSHRYEEFLDKLEDQLVTQVIDQKSQMLQELFKKVKISKTQQYSYDSQIQAIVDRNNILHKTVQAGNQNLYKYILKFTADPNKKDQNHCSALFYAIARKDKIAIQTLLRHGCQVICPQDMLFDLVVKQLKSDNCQFFQLLYHARFKQTLRRLYNAQKRNVLHLSALIGATKSLKYLQQKFKFNLKDKDIYQQTYADYTKGKSYIEKIKEKQMQQALKEKKKQQVLKQKQKLQEFQAKQRQQAQEQRKKQQSRQIQEKQSQMKETEAVNQQNKEQETIVSEEVPESQPNDLQ